MTVTHLGNQRYEGLTADTKPTNVPAGSIYRDIQLDEEYEYNGSSWDKILGSTRTEAFTNKTFDAEGTGNTLSNVKDSNIKAAAAIATTKLADGSNFILKTLDNSFGAHYQDFTKMTAPANPGANDIRLYVDTADTHLKLRNNAGTVVDLHTGGGGGGGDVFLASANVFTAAQKISVDNGSLMTFYRPINTGGFGGGFLYNFRNSSAAEVSYGNEYVSIEDNTASAHRGDFNIQLAIAASLGIRFRVFTSGNGGIICGNNQRILLSETGLTTQRTFTFPDSDQTLVGRTGTSTLTNKTLTAPIFDSYYDLNRISAPSDPGTNVARLYNKQKDSNNDGIFAKIKVGGTISEVELGVADDVLTINELADATVASPAVNQSLVYQTGSATFENKILKTRQWMTTTINTTSNGTRYSAWGAAGGTLTTEANIETTLEAAMTLKRFKIKIPTNGKDGSTTFKLRKNQADVSGTTHTVATTVTTAFDSGELTVAYAVGDEISILCDLSASSNASSMTAIITTEYETSAFA